MKKRASYHQERLWFIDRFERESLYENGPVYHNIPVVWEFHSNINEEALQKSINALIIRHEVFRTTLVQEQENLLQVIHEPSPVEVESWYFSAEEMTREEVIAFLLEKNKISFQNGLGGMLFKFGLLTLADGKAFLLLTIHHALCDDASVNILKRELREFYINSSNSTLDVNLKEDTLQYVDFSDWQRELEGKSFERDLRYWRRKLGHSLQDLELPEDRKREEIHVYHPTTVINQISNEIKGKVGIFCKEREVSSKAFYCAVFKLLLSKLSRLREINIGTSVSDRIQDEFKEVVGAFSNLVVLSDFVRKSDTFDELVAQVQKTLHDAERHSVIPFDRLVAELKPQNDMSRTALFDVLYCYEKRLDEKCAEVTALDFNLGWGKYDYNLLLLEKADVIEILLTYNDLYFDHDSAVALLNGFCKLCLWVLKNTETKLKEADIDNDK